MPVPGDLPQRQHRSRLQNLHLAFEVASAIRNLLRQRLIVRRRAPARRADVGVLESQPIIPVQASSLIREARLVQRRAQKIARAVAREHTPRAIRSMRCGCKSQNQKLRVSISESRDWLPPVRALAIRTPLFLRYFLPIAQQPRTLPASHNFLIQNAEQQLFFSHEVSRSDAPS